jgi:microcystin-dependent protein
MEGYIAEVRLFAGNFAPRGWAFCQGQILSIAQNTALYALLGTTYGGNGQTTYALPDLRGRVAVGPGQGPGLPTVNLGEMSGERNHTLIITEMPAHNHVAQTTLTPKGVSEAGNLSSPSGAYWATSGTLDPEYRTSGTFVDMAAQTGSTTIGVAGGSQPHNNMPPYLGLNYIICMEGIFPSRN